MTVLVTVQIQNSLYICAGYFGSILVVNVLMLVFLEPAQLDTLFCRLKIKPVIKRYCDKIALKLHLMRKLKYLLADSGGSSQYAKKKKKKKKKLCLE